MVTCLIEADSTDEVLADGISACLGVYYKDGLNDLIYPRSRDERAMILLNTLIDANIDVMKYEGSTIFHRACEYLRGGFGVAVLSLFLAKDTTCIKSLGLTS
jgi:hypothetical protein